MRLLLDTHCWLWMQAAPERFSSEALEVLSDGRTELFLSAVSCWEIAVKYGLGKLPLPALPGEYVPTRMKASRTRGLPVQPPHALRVAELPPHHRDPFDRLLVAQSQLERLPLVTADRQLESYDVELHWAT